MIPGQQQNRKNKGQIYDKDAPTEKDYCYQIAKNMCILHQDAV